MTGPVHINEEAPDTRDERADAPHVSRPLLIAVIVMGFLIIVGIVALAGVIVHRVFLPSRAVASLSSGALPVPGPALVEMPPDSTMVRLGIVVKSGEHILSVVPYRNGRVLVLLGQDGNGAQNHVTRIVAWQPETARLLAELNTISAPEQHP